MMAPRSSSVVPRVARCINRVNRVNRMHEVRQAAPAVCDDSLLAMHQDVAAALEQAADLLEAEPDGAALLLDGMLRRIMEHWYGEQGLPAPDAAHLLDDLERRCQPLSWLLRLALRAPDARARLVHAQGLAGAVLAEQRARRA